MKKLSKGKLTTKRRTSRPIVQNLSTGARSDLIRENAIDELVAVLDSKFLSALAEPSRIEVLKAVVRQGRADVNSLASKSSLDKSVVSRHLSLLAEIGIVKREKVQRQVYYELDPITALSKFREILNRMERLVHVCCPPDWLSSKP